MCSPMLQDIVKGYNKERLIFVAKTGFEPVIFSL